MRLFAVAAFAGGCSSAPQGDPTTWEDIAPLFNEHCVSCHQDGGIGPFSLTTYDEAADWAEVSLATMQARTMPPWAATSDGSCGDFKDARWLPDAAIEDVAAWVEAGSPGGSPAPLEPPETPVLEDAVELGTPEFLPEIVGGPLAEFDEYRCFLVDPSLGADRFVTGYAVQPGTPEIVHHLLAMQVEPGAEAASGGMTNLEAIQILDAASPDRPGWPCLGDEPGPEVAFDSIPVTWAPGQGILDYPEGTGVRLRANDVFVVQLHYNLSDPATAGRTDQTRLQLRLAETVEREAFLVIPDGLLAAEGQTLAPGQASLDFSWDLRAEDLGSRAEVLGIFPHMHEYGRRFTAEVERADGRSECAVQVTAWDFNWQLYYFYERPLDVGPDDTIHVTCTYDTTSATEPVLPGWGTRNEMCLLGLFVVL